MLSAGSLTISSLLEAVGVQIDSSVPVSSAAEDTSVVSGFATSSDIGGYSSIILSLGVSSSFSGSLESLEMIICDSLVSDIVSNSFSPTVSTARFVKSSSGGFSVSVVAILSVASEGSSCLDKIVSDSLGVSSFDSVIRVEDDSILIVSSDSVTLILSTSLPSASLA